MTLSMDSPKMKRDKYIVPTTGPYCVVLAPLDSATIGYKRAWRERVSPVKPGINRKGIKNNKN